MKDFHIFKIPKAQGFKIGCMAHLETVHKFDHIDYANSGFSPLVSHLSQNKLN